MLIQILTHTPRWVFAVFALLVFIGWKQLQGGRVGLGRMTLLPVTMTGLSVYGIASVFGDRPTTLAAWAVAGLVTLVLMLRRPAPEGTRYDPTTREFSLPGSAVPLALMMGIFFTKYVVGVLLAMHPELSHEAVFAVAVGALYGGFSGAFFGRSARLWRLAARQGRALAAGSAA